MQRNSCPRAFAVGVSLWLVTVFAALSIAGCSREQSAAPAGAAEAAGSANGSQAASAPGADAPARPSELSFRSDVAPIFAAKCNFCHHPDNAVKVDLTRPFDSALGVINRPNSWTRSEKKILVVPGDPGASALIWKVEQEELAPKIDGDPMPWNIPRLAEQELANLRRWIANGAEDDQLYRSTITGIFGDGVSLGSRGGKCAYCHYPGAGFGPDLANPFDPNRGAVGVRSAYGEVRVVPGDPDASLLFAKVVAAQLPGALGRPMPLHLERLTEAERRTLRDWITEGAKDN